LYVPPSVIRVINLRRKRWAGHVSRMGKMRNVCKVSVGKPEEKGSVVRRRLR
jgi:hypothetical protein